MTQLDLKLMRLTIPRHNNDTAGCENQHTGWFLRLFIAQLRFIRYF
jgi:hypothetical protein